MAFNILVTPSSTPVGSPEIRKDSFKPFDELVLVEFPLKSYTNDISLLKNSKVVDQLFNDDGRLFLELLEVCCTGKGIAEISSKFKETIPSNLVNRLDRYQDAAPLHYACINGHLEVVKYLVETLNADVDIWDGQKRVTPLICAAAHGHLPVVSLLLNYGCDVNAGLNETSTGDIGKTCVSAILWAVKRDHPPVVQCLLQNNAGQHSTVLYSETPLHAAVTIGSSSIIEMLLRHKEPSKVDVHMGPRRDTPLHLAARGEFPNSVETCKVLLQMGNVSVNEINANGKTALHLASAANNHEIIKQLLSHWASVDVQDKNGRTPLFHMISDATEALKSLEVLIFRGKCNVNHQDMYGYTALHLAGSRMAERAAEILLMSGADFSLKAVGGVSALSILQRKIPNTSILLRQAFDQAVTISQPGNTLNDIQGDGNGGRQDCKIKVNFKYVLPSLPLSSYALGEGPVVSNKEKTTRYPRMATIFFAENKESEEDISSGERKETAKVKCLVEENLSSLLLHPVVHSFLDMKWEKARPILLPAVLFKVAFVLLFSIYAELPYWMREDQIMINATSTLPQKGIMRKEASLWFTAFYYALITMVSIKGLMELTHFLRAPKIQWRSLEHWISLTVLLILIINMKPSKWADKSQKPYHRSMAALGILLAWIDIWINMSRFPKLGLSIRVFFQVFKNFTSFILPHICLLAGFVLSLTLLFNESGEFSQVPLTMPKLVRIMAGDITITGQGMTAITPTTPTKEAITHYLLVYIYTAFVLMVAIVLMNLLIGLAVNDIQGIYAEASINKLVKQTILLNTLESSFKGPLIRFCLPKQFQSNYINLFKTGSENKTVVFKPYDSRDQKISTELKQALLNTDNATVTGGNQNLEEGGIGNDEALSSPNVRVWKNAVTKLIQKKDDDHKVLMDKINELVSSYLAEKKSQT